MAWYRSRSFVQLSAYFPAKDAACFLKFFLPAVTARWSINAVSSSSSEHKIIEHGRTETNELNRTLMSHLTHYDSVWLIMTHMAQYASYDSV